MSVEDNRRVLREARMPAEAVVPFDAVIFDMDGVVTDTAGIHASAWKQLFDDLLTDARIGQSRPDPFEPDSDYRRYVDGRSRIDGIRDFLDSRGIVLPEGEPADPPGSWTVHGLASRKNEIYLGLLSQQGLRVFSGSVALLRRLRSGQIPTALVTASLNAAQILAAAQLREVFDVVVDGTVAAELGLPGKPQPATFLEAARRLGVQAERAVVVEDAVAGVQAAKSGNFGLVVGIDRGGQREVLEEGGADLVLGDVGQLDLGVLRAAPGDSPTSVSTQPTKDTARH